MENINNFLSVTDIAKILDVSVEAVNSWLKKGFIKYSLVGNLQKIRSKNLLEYLKGLGNSDYAMKEFSHDIKFYLTEKALEEAKTTEEVKALVEKDPKMFNDVMLNSKSHLPGSIIGSSKGKNGLFKDSKEAEKYLSEAKTLEEKAKRYAEILNYEEGTGDKPWGKQ